eukprot:8680886-Pyramimonas_sp.AAC.1
MGLHFSAISGPKAALITERTIDLDHPDGYVYNHYADATGSSAHKDYCDRSRDHELLHPGGILYRLPGANTSPRRREHGPRY